MRAVLFRWMSIALPALFLLSMTGTPVLGQDLERLAPKSLQLPAAPAQIQEPPLPEPSSAEPDRLLLKQLRGMTFLHDPEKVLQQGSPFDGIRSDEPMPESFYREMRPFLNQPLTMGTLSEILKKVVLFYRTESKPVVDAYFPEQDITGGNVQILVIVGRVGAVWVEGNRWFRSEDIESQMNLRPGDLVLGNVLTEDVNWLNRNPFRHIDLVLARGEKRGETDVILRTRDRFPVRVFGGYENSGTPLTGRDRYLAGFNYGDAFGLGHLLDYQFTANQQISRMHGHSLRYEIPLPWHDSLQFAGAYAKSHPDLDPFDLEAKSWEVSGRYLKTLPSLGKFRHEASLGVEYKYSDSNLEFSNTPVFDKKTEIVQAVLGYGGAVPDPFGRTAFHLQLVDSPGDLASHNDDRSFDQYKQGASAQYLYCDLDIDRLTALPKGFSWNLKARLQFADGNLLGSEQLGLGGYSSVRGFEEREANGDEGLLLVNEIRTPGYDLSRLFNLPFRSGNLQFLGFWDYGLVRDRNESHSTILSSLGVGCRYNLGSRVSLRFDFGWQQIGKGLDDRVDSMGHVGLVVGY